MAFWQVWRNKYLLQQIYAYIRGNDADKAARYGNLQAFKYSTLTGYSKKTMNFAAINDHLEVIRWLHENRTEGCTPRALNRAAAHGYLEVVKYLHENHTDLYSGNEQNSFSCAMDRAAAYGRLEVVKYLHHVGVKCTECAMNRAAKRGHLEVVQWLHENRIGCCIPNVLDWIEIIDYIGVVRWLHKKYCVCCDTNAIIHAAVNGQLKTVKWLHKNRTEGCSVESVECAMATAAEHGHLNVVQYLHSIGVKCTKYIMYNTVRRGHLHVVKYLHSIEAKLCSDNELCSLSNAIDYATVNGHTEVVEFLRTIVDVK